MRSFILFVFFLFSVLSQADDFLPPPDSLKLAPELGAESYFVVFADTLEKLDKQVEEKEKNLEENCQKLGGVLSWIRETREAEKTQLFHAKWGVCL